MATKHQWTRGIGWVLIVLEGLWALYWIGAMLFIQISTDDTNHGFDYRFSIILSAFHAVSPIALIGVLNEHHRYSAMAAFYFVFAFMTDLWSLLDAVLHLNSIDNYDAWRLCLGVSCWAIALSVLTLVWYGIFVLWLKGKASEFTKDEHSEPPRQAPASAERQTMAMSEPLLMGVPKAIWKK